MAPALQKIVVAPTTNPISMLLLSLGGQFENTFLDLGSGWNLEVIDTSRIQHQLFKSG